MMTHEISSVQLKPIHLRMDYYTNSSAKFKLRFLRSLQVWLTTSWGLKNQKNPSEPRTMKSAPQSISNFRIQGQQMSPQPFRAVSPNPRDTAKPPTPYFLSGLQSLQGPFPFFFIDPPYLYILYLSLILSGLCSLFSSTTAPLRLIIALQSPEFAQQMVLSTICTIRAVDPETSRSTSLSSQRSSLAQSNIFMIDFSHTVLSCLFIREQSKFSKHLRSSCCPTNEETDPPYGPCPSHMIQVFSPQNILSWLGFPLWPPTEYLEYLKYSA